MTIHVWGAENTAIISANQDAPGSLPIVNLAHRDTGDSRDHYWAVLLVLPPPPPSVQLP